MGCCLDASIENNNAGEDQLDQSLQQIVVPPITNNVGVVIQTDSPISVQYDERVVAFVDILGFKEIIRKSRSDPDLVRRVYTALDVSKDDWTTMYAAELGLQKSPDDFDDRFHSFSDFITMSVKPNIEEIGLLIYTIFKVCRQLLGQGFLSRGGIAKGLLYHRDDGEPSMIFGPAFIDAYQFESTHADGPRVILQSDVWQTIETYKRDNPATRLAKFFDVHLPRASDGPPFIDLFVDFHDRVFYNQTADLTTEIETIHRYICKALDESFDKPHYFKKNAELAKEFNLAVMKVESLHRFKIPGSKLPQRHGN